MKQIRRQCQAQLFYDTITSGRVMADGEARYLKGGRCLNREVYTDRRGDGWCQVHARNSNVVANYGPMKRIR